MPDINREYEAQHLQNLASQQKQVQVLYYAVLDEVFRASTGITITNTTFRITDYPALNSAITRILTAFQQQLMITLVNGIQGEFNLSTAKNLALLEQKYGTVAEPVKQAFRNQQAFSNFIARKTRRLTLSDRVWNLTNQLQAEIEQTLFVGLSEGQSAAKMAQEAKRFLKEPDRLFRRLRNAKGKLVLSKPAKLYKPGVGIYKSSYKNALRLSRTETNAAYRAADGEQWKNTKFVLGYEIKLSRNHPAYDICDNLAGVYPVDFDWVHWHPNCICYKIPVLASKEQYDKYEDALLVGEADKFKFEGRIKDVSPAFKAYVAENREKMEGWKQLPNWMVENKRFVKSE
ncbi:hypothetical protein AHMF7605_11850 [Adhaeribacter arboris]|uniref:Phage head morphogenesis domain-containing protein n=1 Tax=Adhaeribacter arboris TaxID=2072846 RepID=A0A2T2YF74_9BACT|nr:hypothetical protein [Adhaeribacter arboris]PSR54165.1 hypothetical protein AHMF7605_11850 [Adhaeribacter arboris]